MPDNVERLNIRKGAKSNDNFKNKPRICFPKTTQTLSVLIWNFLKSIFHFG